MQAPQETPIHWDSNRRSMNLTFIFALIVAVFGLWGLTQGDGGVVLILGLVVAAYSWLTTPKHYMIFPGYMVIMFGTPRKRVIPFHQISHVEFLSLPSIGDRLRLRMANGRSLMLQPRDSETFHDRLEEALSSFHAAGARDYIEGESSTTGDET